MADIRCFLLEPTGRSVRSLRTYEGADAGTPKCPGFGYHNAKARLDIVDGEAPSTIATDEDRAVLPFPTKCDHCDFVFTDAAFRQIFVEHEHRRSDTGGLTTIMDAPVGALWWAHWLTGHHESPKHKARGGGPHLILKTPAGEWDIDSPSSNANGEGWDRTGNPPNVTARPSILIGKDEYHGFLTDGVLSSC